MVLCAASALPVSYAAGDGYCKVKDGECWLENVHIAQHSTTGRFFQHEETRARRLLLPFCNVALRQFQDI